MQLSIMRIMSQMLCSMPFDDLPAEAVVSVLQIAFNQATKSRELVALDYYLNEFS